MKKNIRKVKKFQKTLIFLLIILISVISYTIGRFMNTNADEISYEYQSNNIGYDSTNNSLTATNVKDAIDELYEKVGQCPTGYNCLTDEEFIATGTKYIRAYIYDENSCVTGEEEICKKTFCYLSKNKNACSSGTIIDYKVNNTEIVRFHVLHDDENTITMQAQKNTVYNTAWYLGGSNHKEGPQKIMAALKTSTNGWSNVKDITLEDGMEQFNDGASAHNKCTATSCSLDDENYGYSYSKLVNNVSIGNTVKARMITITETSALGCTTSFKSCPIYLYNYLYGSTDYCRVSGKCTNDQTGGANWGYWTMSAFSSDTRNALTVDYDGAVDEGHSTPHNYFGARAVVVVDK